MRKVIFSLLFISMSTGATSKSLNVTTSVDISQLYVDSITSVEFIPDVLNLTSTQDKSRFDEVNTTLIVETDIPPELSGIGYISTLKKNITTCTDYSGVSSVQSDFVDVSIDGQNISEGESIAFLDFNLSNELNKYSEHEVKLMFKAFNDIVTDGKAEKCNGEIEFSIEVDI